MLGLILLILLPHTNCGVIYMNLPSFNRNILSNETYLHLRHDKVRALCKNRDTVCKSNNTVICTVRQVNGRREFKEFNNSCLLFMNNMCENPGEEFNIASSGTCNEYLKSRQLRRHSILTSKNDKMDKNSTINKSSTKSILREETYSTLYDIDTAFDYHICPFSCPDTYSPVCVCVNRSFGLYFKFYTFINHCEADRYYCKHWEDFSPPPDEDENIQSSQLGWSYCGSSRYLQFARFAEVTSSLGHYGWLDGEYGYSHIMEPYERKPGYG